MLMMAAPVKDTQETAELTTVAFTVGERPYLWSDVVLAAMRWGNWAEVEDAAACGLACQRRAEVEAIALDPAARAKAGAAFRYARGLVTADEMTAWLAGWGLTVDDWLSWIDRDVLRARWAAAATDFVARFPIGEHEIAAAAWPEGVCSGALARLGRALAGRAAAWAALTEQGGPDGCHASPQIDVSVLAEVAQDALGGRLASGGRERLAHLAAVDAAFETFRARAITPKAIESVIAGRRLDWIRLSLEMARFGAEEAAREAACCVREDGAALADVARAAGASLTEGGVLLGETPSDLRAHLLGAEAGQLLGPVAIDGETVLVLVRDKALPDASQPEVRQRAEEQALAGAVRREVDARVLWRMEP